jgi:hypothetical protein
VAQEFTLQQANSVFSTDATLLVLDVVEHEGLQGLFYLFGGFHVGEPFHHRVQVEISIPNVTVAKHSPAQTVNSLLGAQDNIFKVSRVKGNIEFKGQAVVGGSH